jgi:acetolactate synthase-1/3 small subunit
LVDVVALQDITVNQHLEREVVLVKVKITDQSNGKADLDRLVDAFNASLIEVSSQVFIVEMSGSSQKVDELLKTLVNITILEIARSGATGLTSDETALTL